MVISLIARDCNQPHHWGPTTYLSNNSQVVTIVVVFTITVVLTIEPFTTAVVVADELAVVGLVVTFLHLD